MVSVHRDAKDDSDVPVAWDVRHLTGEPTSVRTVQKPRHLLDGLAIAEQSPSTRISSTATNMEDISFVFQVD